MQLIIPIPAFILVNVLDVTHLASGREVLNSAPSKLGTGPWLRVEGKSKELLLMGPSRSLSPGARGARPRGAARAPSWRALIRVWILGGGGQIEIRCVHGMVWHGPDQIRFKKKQWF